jgi:hypothetical protein
MYLYALIYTIYCYVLIYTYIYCYALCIAILISTAGLQFAPFNGSYPEHLAHLKAANLDLSHNMWYDVYDHNDPGNVVVVVVTAVVAVVLLL